ncbi:MAG: pyridoxal 5'-phosphate synthase glutaminase subunit PdxT [Thermoplasmata archaeon]
MKVGVLALQGDVPEHLAALAAIIPGDDIVPVRTPAELASVGALFLPGGESTTIARLLVQAGLWNPLAERLRSGFPVLATCAGLILLARELSPSATGLDPPTLGVVDAQVRRNDYGTQRESFEAPVRVEGLAGGPFPGVFIRSPRILSLGPDATAIAWRGDEVVGLRSGAVWGLTFHPELSGDPRVHRMFLEAAHATQSKSTARKGRTRRKPG